MLNIFVFLLCFSAVFACVPTCLPARNAVVLCHDAAARCAGPDEGWATLRERVLPTPFLSTRQLVVDEDGETRVVAEREPLPVTIAMTMLSVYCMNPAVCES